MNPATKAAILKQLAVARAGLSARTLAEWFDAEPSRVRDLTLELQGLLLDYSRNLVTPDILELLLQLAEASDVADWRERLFNGETVNNTEQRAALHTLLRASAAPPGLTQVFADVKLQRDRMREFAQAVRGGARKGATGQVFTDLLCIGIGGSHLGPELVIEALAPPTGTRPRAHFLSNVDPEQAARLLAALDPARTLVIVASKTFTTQETLANAETARAWLTDALGAGAVAQHFVAVTAAPQRAAGFGIEREHIFGFEDWVGGRYSLWSAVGLPIAVALGPEHFDALLAGAARMDAHFRTAPLEKNLPVVMALLGIWYTDFFGAQSRAVIPYRQGLRLLPDYLQQLEMESNGKGVTRDGAPVENATAPVLWGGVGTNGQHAFFQLLHQGMPFVPVEFIAVIADATGNRRQQDMLLANCFAQAEALMRGRSEAAARAELEAQGERGERLALLAKHKTFPGNRPSSLLLLDRLDADTLGMLIALYEHKVFVQACIWGINPFDQMGVELGKELAGRVLAALSQDNAAALADPASRALAARVIAHRKP
ncbi:MAG TPA: glucose-6-phosphate isomerase [Gammaproteobacteria bacterium]|nr:glucose-6-phosphate isomerase [Gammaproteobacteria bacterium]